MSWSLSRCLDTLSDLRYQKVVLWPFKAGLATYVMSGLWTCSARFCRPRKSDSCSKGLHLCQWHPIPKSHFTAITHCCQQPKCSSSKTFELAAVVVGNMQSGISQFTSFTQQVRRMRDVSFLLDSSTANAILTGRWRCQSPLAAWSVPLQTFYFHWSGKSNRNPKQRVITYPAIVIQVASSRPGPSNLLTCDLRHTSCQKPDSPALPTHCGLEWYMIDGSRPKTVYQGLKQSIWMHLAHNRRIDQHNILLEKCFHASSHKHVLNLDLLEHSCPRSLGIFWVAENIFRMNRYQETFQACEERPLICLERKRVLHECVRLKRFHDSVCIFPPALSQHGCMQSERRTRLKMCEIGQQGCWCDALPSPVGLRSRMLMVFRFQSHQSISFFKGDTVTSPQFGCTTKLNQQTTACVPQTVYFPPSKDSKLCFSKATLAHSRIKKFHDSSGQSSLCPQWIPAWQEGNMQNTWESWDSTRRKHTATAKTSPLAESTHSHVQVANIGICCCFGDLAQVRHWQTPEFEFTWWLRDSTRYW